MWYGQVGKAIAFGAIIVGSSPATAICIIFLFRDYDYICKKTSIIYNTNDEDFIKIVKTADSYSDIAKKLNLPAKGGNINTIKRRIKLLNLNPHFTRKNMKANLKRLVQSHYRSDKEIFCKNSNARRATLKRRIINEHLMPIECNLCYNKQWLEHKIPLELHHINGDSNDNRLNNLQLLCPNCHALTSNYRNRKRN